MRKWFEPLFGVFPDNAITAHWTACSLILQCMLAMVLIAAAGLQPLIHYGALSLSCRFLAALAQPVSDKRIVGALSTMGEGCAWLLKLLLTAQILCMLAFLVLMAGG